MAQVALIASSFHPRVGGVEEHVRHTARALRARGISVVIWTVDRGDPVPAVVDGVPVRVLPCPLPARNARSLASFARRAPAAFTRWLRAARADRPGILHVHCFGPNGVWALALARVLRLPLVVTAHGETFGDADGVFATSALLRRSLRAALQRADAVTACSRFTARDLEERFELAPDRAEVIMNGVDLDEPAGTAPSLPGRYVLALGRVVHTKGFDLLLRAFAQARLPDDVSVVIGGDGPERPALEALADEQGLVGRVLFTGRLDRGAVVRAAAASAALAVPSRVEPFGIVLLEGWRAGVPVIATSHGGPPELINDGTDGWLVDPGDTVAFAAALERIFDVPEVSARIAAAGRDRVTAFTWDRIAAEYATVYERARVRRARG
ncbi:hypothetical protein BOH66_13810 [Microbacterium aurum]|uniref:D-inositol 3-phosphate glycosyltransferase n=1 Tax=Microbacterium aurum TaxID=36805 RepID=A0A1P8UAQ1_9MICO|nr:glycosyltransferase family 4 protein [Microbacterium aurum]APZ35201.1 hypothetical protein BOH66_13810 [Microbacterium aurum]